MKSLLDQTHFGGLKLKNRFVRSATRDGMADTLGHATPEMIEVYRNLARGGVGTIITGHAYVTDREQSKQPRQMGIYDDACIDGYRELTDAVHSHDANIVMQINCVGAQTFTSGGDRVIWGPSAVQDLYTKLTPKEMSREEIRYLRQAFADAALRAKKAGFDGVQIHAAHGYIASKFLNPYYNVRTDEYGGSLENRARLLLEIFAAIRREVGESYPVLVKINCSDFMDHGMTFEECRCVCRMLAEAGASALEISGGTLGSWPNEGPIRIIRADQEHHFRPYAEQIARDVDVPVLLVGGNRDFGKMNEILNRTEISYFSLSRPLICESSLINRWLQGDLRPAKCVSCNKCLGLETTSCIFKQPHPHPVPPLEGEGT